VIAGPAQGDSTYALGPRAAYAFCAVGFLAAMLGVANLGGRRPNSSQVATVRERIRPAVDANDRSRLGVERRGITWRR
jgi:hypothetical protein